MIDSILILGEDYKDCMAVFNNLNFTENIKYKFITQTDHLYNITSYNYIKSDNFNNNPNATSILTKINKLRNKQDNRQLKFSLNEK